MSSPSKPSTSFSLQDKFTLERGHILLTGIQALLRLPLDQHRADQRRGLHTATLISGYRGSPLAGIDLGLQRMPHLLRQHHIHFLPAVNEDLGATAVWGSQFAHTYPGPKYDGVLGMWYGKAPGVDRSGDILKHANFSGTGKNGGVLALCGDDPTAKSSTLPSQSEYALLDANMPILYPGNVQEILDLGLLGFALSRYCGLWVGFKIVTDVADSFGTARVGPERLQVKTPEFTFGGKAWQHSQSNFLLAPVSLQLEQEMLYGRLEAARQFARHNQLNHLAVNARQAWLGIVSAGKTYHDLRQALLQLGLDEAQLQARGIRLLKLGMTYPLEPQLLTDFARGLEQIWVVEEKRPFIEEQLKAFFYHHPNRPQLWGKTEPEGALFVPAEGELDADRLLPLLYRGLLPKLGSTVLGEKPPFDGWQPAADEPGLNRTPFYCSGCPHNTSTLQLPEGSQAAAGIGCHGMAIGLPHTHGITHMGGEGVQWVGAAPFTTTPHLFQNLGDGTLFHSGSLAIRQAVAAGTSITFKILYNAAVGMTGGQQADGAVGVPELTRMLQAQGVRHIIVTTDEPDKYPPGATWASGVEVWHRDRILEAQQKLKEIQGVTVLIHDQGCAAELRRMRRKGQAPDPPMRVFINEAVCEGCGDCGRKSNCLSVIPVQTDFGRKTQIHQASCNKDFSCLKGDCPAFVSVVPKKQLKKETHIPQITDELPRPNCHSGEAAQLYMVGIGGTGVVTVNQILGTAAMLEGKVVKALDQTGLSQKGGTVVAHLKIMPQEQAVSPKIAAGGADAYIAFDMLAAATHKHLKYAAPGKTIGIVSTSRIATGQMVADPRADFPEVERLSSKIDAHTRKHYNHYLDTQALSQALFRSHLPANLLQIGVAFQAGCIPLRAESIEQAIELNGVAVAQNIQAFRAGRKALLDPEWAAQLQQIRPGAMKAPPLPANAPDLPAALKSLPESVQQLIARRYADLCAYQNPAYARQYLEFVQGVQQAEATALGQHRITEAVARYLYKLMAYKDEYEVARLHLQPQAGQALQDTFGQVSRVAYWLHPPLLRALGWKKKIRFGSWIRPFFRLLYALRLLRGTALDPFGYARVRKTERQLVRDYCQMIERLMEQLDESRADTILKLAELPDLIRGYEEVKMKNVQLYERQKAEYLADLQTAVVSEQHGD